jgi:uncharacterized protein YbjT (DUF2867 family)
MKTILLAGGTGLIGIELLGRLLRDEAFDGRVVAPTRRAIGVAHPKLLNPVVDPSVQDDEALAKAVRDLGIERIDVYISCLGTTIVKAGSRVMFRAVDHDLVLRWARIARHADATQALLVSSVGASPSSSSFYLRTKGDVERDLQTLRFDRVDVMRPAQLLGEREDFRPIERFAQSIARFYSPLLPKPHARYKAIDAGDVAEAMAVLVREDSGRGQYTRFHHHDQMMAMAKPR